jgi:exopolysaccharide production protein ExoQ
MPPSLALALTLVGIAVLIARDVRLTRGVSHAIWIPLLWMAIISSRSVTEWIYGDAAASGDAFLDGSPLDRAVFMALIAAATAVLVSRSVSLTRFARQNPWLTAFFIYGLVSVIWSDFPFVAFKRWYKVVGHVVMVLVVFTEREPLQAFMALFRRCAYLLSPLSVTFIKYFPTLGRQFSPWTGAAINTGVTTNKNMLGNFSFVMILFFVVSLFVKSDSASARRVERGLYLVFVVMNGWLLLRADSATSLGSGLLGVALILLTRIRLVEKYINVVALVAVLAMGALHLSGLNPKDLVAESLDRDSTLTGRTELWEDLATIPLNPVVGAGWESFWLGERLAGLWERHPWGPNQAHNGYYETYLNLGLIGLLLQCLAMFSFYWRARKVMSVEASSASRGSEEFAIAQFRFAYAVAFAVYNVTEAAFKTLHPSFFVFFIAAVEYGALREARVRRQRGAETTAAKPWSRHWNSTQWTATRSRGAPGWKAVEPRPVATSSDAARARPGVRGHGAGTPRAQLPKY